MRFRAPATPRILSARRHEGTRGDIDKRRLAGSRLAFAALLFHALETTTRWLAGWLAGWLAASLGTGTTDGIRMKITIPIDVWDPRRGGLERYLALLSASLVARGHEVTILCARRADRDGGGGSGTDAGGSDDSSGGPNVETLAVPAWPRWRRELAFARRSVERFRERGDDILFAVRHALEAHVYQPHGGSYRSATRAALEGAPPPLRVAKSLLRSLRPTHRVLWWLDGEVFRRSPDVLTLSLSQVVERSLERAFPGAALRFERIPNGIPLEEFHDRDRVERAAELRSAFGIPSQSPVGLFLAHQFRAKGLAHAIRGLGAAGRWHLVVGGRGRPARFAALARHLGLESRVHFAGAIADARAAYAGADAFVLPTYYDSCSLSVLEALACGTPVITTRQNGAAELYEDGREGFVLRSPREEGALARALRELGEHIDEFRERARAASARFSWDAHVDQVVGALERRRSEIGRAASTTWTT